MTVTVRALLDMPNEVLSHTVNYLDIPSIKNFARSCKQAHSVTQMVMNSALLRMPAQIKKKVAEENVKSAIVLCLNRLSSLARVFGVVRQVQTESPKMCGGLMLEKIITSALRIAREEEKEKRRLMLRSSSGQLFKSLSKLSAHLTILSETLRERDKYGQLHQSTVEALNDQLDAIESEVPRPL